MHSFSEEWWLYFLKTRRIKRYNICYCNPFFFSFFKKICYICHCIHFMIITQYIILSKNGAFWFFLSFFYSISMNTSSKIIASPLWDLFALATETHLVELRFADSKTKHDQEMIENRVLSQTETELKEYFSGKRKHFSIPLAPEGTDFQKQAWKALEKIPYWETRSYKQEALLAGNPKAIRAIGWANNKNPIIIIIPCHRVIGADGKLVGYGWGIERKKWLLEHEKNI